MSEELPFSGANAEDNDMEQTLYDTDWGDLYESELMIVEDESDEDITDHASSTTGSNTGVPLSTEDNDESQVEPATLIVPIADIMLSRIVKNLLLSVRKPEDPEASAFNVEPATLFVPIADILLSRIVKNLLQPVRNPADEETALNMGRETFIAPIAESTLARIRENLKHVLEAGVEPEEELTRNEPMLQLTTRKHVKISVGPPEESINPTDKADDWLDKCGFDLNSFTLLGEENTKNHLQQGPMEITPQVNSAFHRYARPHTNVVHPQDPPVVAQAPDCGRFSEEALEAMFRRRDHALRVLKDLHCRFLEDARFQLAPPVLGVPPLGQGIPHVVIDQALPAVDHPRVEINGVPERFWGFLNTPDWADYELNKRLVKEIERIHKAKE